jgi:hypothetical protein
VAHKERGNIGPVKGLFVGFRPKNGGFCATLSHGSQMKNPALEMSAGHIVMRGRSFNQARAQ